MKQTIRNTFFFVFIFLFSFPYQLFASSFGVKPAYPRTDNSRTDSIFVHTIKPGTSAKDGVRVINNTNEPKHLLLYARDSTQSSGGGFACKQLSDKSNGVGSWIHFNLSNLEENTENIKPGPRKETVDITIPIGEDFIIPFTITTPANTSVGEHNGCILVQEMKEKAGGSGVSLSLRSGLRVAVTIPGMVERSLSFSNFKIKKKGGSIYLMPSVKNTGNVSIDTKASVKVRYFFGLLQSEFGGQFPVLRDQNYDFNFELKKPFWGGFYMVKAIFSYDKSAGAGIGVETGEKLSKISSNTIWFFSAPTIWGLITEIIILIFLLFLFAIYKLNKKKKRWIKRWVPYTLNKNDTLEKISRENRIHWELFAEVNKIKPPYILKEGQKVLIPPRRKNPPVLKK